MDTIRICTAKTGNRKLTEDRPGEYVGDARIFAVVEIRIVSDEPDTTFSVTHVPSGFAVAIFPDRKQAMLVAVELVRILPPDAYAALHTKGHRKAVKAFPKSVVAWLKACRKAQRYLDPRNAKVGVNGVLTYSA